MSIWDMLGIEPTDEQRKIKRAYSKRIATCHPEDNPEEFQALQRAYEMALAYARGEMDESDLETFDNVAEYREAAEQAEQEENEGEEEDEGFDDDEPAFVRPRTRIRNIFAPLESDEDDEHPAEGRRVAFTDASEARLDAVARMDDEMYAQADASSDGMGYVTAFLREERKKERSRLDKLEFEFEMLQDLIDEGENLESYFKRGIYKKYRDVEGFEERLAAMLEPYVESLNMVDLSELQDAIGYDQDEPGPLTELFDGRFEGASPITLIKDIFSFIKRA